MDELFRRARSSNSIPGNPGSLICYYILYLFIYYGFEITMGLDRKPVVREFGNAKSWNDITCCFISSS